MRLLKLYQLRPRRGIPWSPAWCIIRGTTWNFKLEAKQNKHMFHFFVDFFFPLQIKKAERDTNLFMVRLFELEWKACVYVCVLLVVHRMDLDVL